MPYLTASSLGADETSGSTVLLEINERTKAIVESQKSAERWRRWQAIIAVFGSVFAAVRLGVIALPQIRERVRSRPLGSLAAPTANPRRRRRRR